MSITLLHKHGLCSRQDIGTDPHAVRNASSFKKDAFSTALKQTNCKTKKIGVFNTARASVPRSLTEPSKVARTALAESFPSQFSLSMARTYQTSSSKSPLVLDQRTRFPGSARKSKSTDYASPPRARSASYSCAGPSKMALSPARTRSLSSACLLMLVYAPKASMIASVSALSKSGELSN